MVATPPRTGVFVVHIGTHGDCGAHRADVFLPGAAYRSASIAASARRPARWTPSSRAREELYYDKDRLLANGDRWERQLAKNIELDAPYR